MKKNELTNAEISKLTMSTIYDKLVEIVYLLIINIFDKHKTLPIQLKKIISLVKIVLFKYQRHQNITKIRKFNIF